MSHFYSVIQGSRGPATRCGTKRSGVSAIAASWEGSVRSNVWYNDEFDEDWVTVTLSPWHGAGGFKILFEGPISGKNVEEIMEKLWQKPLV